MTKPDPQFPAPGTPEFIAMIERQKDAIERETGVRPDFILDIGAGDMTGNGAPEIEEGERR